MNFQSILLTGGAGFIGSNLAGLLAQRFGGVRVSVVDSLKRRGSELSLVRLRDAGVEFYHGDIRCPEDLQGLPDFDLLIDCSAEPSVQSGVGGSPMYVLNTNLVGTLNLLELARTRSAAFLFLSTSRVYPIAALNNARYEEEATRFRWSPDDSSVGLSEHGVAEEFPLSGARSLYGTSKLAGELLLEEYVYNYDLKGLINRCGIITGPWQMGKVDQGVVTLWVARHYFQQPLKYIGYGGTGKQVRDVLHVEDLFDLITRQLERADEWKGQIYNVGGGQERSISLVELTDHCREVTGRTIPIAAVPDTSAVDLRIFVTDSRHVSRHLDWQPTRSVRTIVKDIHHWIQSHEADLRPILL